MRDAMNNMYAMQRANGDWFAFAERGDWRVPLFRSSGNAMSARMHNAGMLLFKPVAIDAHAVSEMAFNDNNRAVHFWLVDSPSTDVNRGHFIEHAQLDRLVSTTKEQTEVDVEV
jgi:hypothetical protein